MPPPSPALAGTLPPRRRGSAHHICAEGTKSCFLRQKVPSAQATCAATKPSRSRAAARLSVSFTTQARSACSNHGSAPLAQRATGGATVPATTGTRIHRLDYDAWGRPLNWDETQLHPSNSATNPGSTDTAAVNQAFGKGTRVTWGGIDPTYSPNEEGTRLTTWGEVTGTEGEPDEHLVYLRARTYDPTTGAFLSMDSHPGAMNRPVTLHDYAYANNNPVNVIDPSGAFGIGGFSVGAGISLSLSAINVARVGGFALGAAAAIELERKNRPFGLWDAVVATLVKSGTKTYPEIGRPDELHHTIPYYLCGGSKQTPVRVKWTEHKLLHFSLAGLWLNIAGAEEITDRLFRVNYKRSSEVTRFATTREGRTVIAAGIRHVYDEGNFWELGEKPPPTIATAFNAAVPAYEAGTDWTPTCVRP